MTNAHKIPIWISIYAGIQILTSIVGIVGGYVDPSFFYTQFPNADFNDNLVRHLAGVWGSKNLGIVVVAVWAMVRRHPRVLGSVFAMKFIADTVDILYTNNAFLPDASIIQNIISWLILGLPQAIAAYVLFKRSNMQL